MFLDFLFITIPYTILVMGVIYNIIHLIQLPIAYYEFRKCRIQYKTSHLWETLTSHAMLPISLLVPTWNEETTIVENIRSMLALHYPEFEVIVINDGSTDNTMRILTESFALKPIHRTYRPIISHKPVYQLYSSRDYPCLTVVNKENGGKADALNAGINLAIYPLFCSIDADSILEHDALLHAVQPFIQDPDHVVATGGSIRIVNGCTIHAGKITHVGLPQQLLPLLQTIEYLRAFLIARLAWSNLRALTIISGAFALFKRETVIDIGGYSTHTVGEDMEIILRMHRYLSQHHIPYTMRFISRPVCWTKAPETFYTLGRQRMRWQRGALESFFAHTTMLGNWKYGRAGMLGLPYNLLVDVLNPPIEVLGYLLFPLSFALGMLSLEFALAYAGLVFGIGIFISISCLVLAELETKRFPGIDDMLRLIGAAILENFGYRQINNIWKLMGYIQFVRGDKQWG